MRCRREKWRGWRGVGGFGGGVLVGVEDHESLKNGADLTEDGEGGFVKDSRAEVVVEMVAEGFEERAGRGEREGK